MIGMTRNHGESERPPRVSRTLLRWFTWYGLRYTAKRFHAVRMLRTTPAPASFPRDRPVVVYLNHPAWWDPMIGLVLAARTMPGRSHFAVIDAAALAKYRFFARLGFVGVEQGTRRGAADFLRAGRAILSSPDAVFWVAAEGAFTDPRSRPARLRPGVAHLAKHADRAVFVPLALEYPFWRESKPEALGAWGEPIGALELMRLTTAERTAELARRLEAAQDSLAVAAIARDPARFETILHGAAGVGGPFDGWRRLRALMRGQRFDPSHGEDA